MFAGFLFISKFQSTLPRRERRTDFGIGDTVPDFNPRSREGSDCYQTLKLRRQLTFQSTLPRRERHALDAVQTAWNVISIHAPAKGATNYSEYVGRRVKISIHAPAKGATRYHNTNRNQYRFQSTLPRRERHKIEQLKADFEQFQSTLPRRERLFLFPAVLCSNDFNPRSREGSDLIARSISDTDKPFQSTLPRRERRKRLKCICTH